MRAWISTRPAFIVAGLAVLTLGLRAVLIWRTGFDGLYGQDAFAYLDYSASFRTALSHGEWPPPFFWPIGYPGWIAVLSLVMPTITAAQAVSLLACSAIVVLTFLTAREFLSGRNHATAASITAGLLVAFGGQMLISSLASMSDAIALLWASLSLFALARSRRKKLRGWLALAGFALGWAIITRWVYGLLIPVWAAAILMDFTPDERWPSRGAAALAKLPDVAVVLVFLVLGLLPQLALIAHDAGSGTIAHIGDIQTYSWSPANFWQSDLTNADGHFHYARPVGLYYAMPLVHPDYLPIWFTPLMLFGIWTLRHHKFVLTLLLGWIGLMWLFLGGTLWENWRFPLAFLPPMALLAGAGLQAGLELARGRRVRIAGVLVAAGLIVMLGWGVRDAKDFIGHQMQDRAIVRWASAALPPDATVLTFGMTATLAHFTPLRVVEMADESPESVEQIGRDDKDVFVLLDVENVEAQWPGLAPQVNFHVLRDGLGLRTLGTDGAYVLYAVGRTP